MVASANDDCDDDDDDNEDDDWQWTFSDPTSLPGAVHWKCDRYKLPGKSWREIVHIKYLNNIRNECPIFEYLHYDWKL